jgi:hypothetical protein
VRTAFNANPRKWIIPVSKINDRLNISFGLHFLNGKQAQQGGEHREVLRMEVRVLIGVSGYRGTW